ncbi:thiol reductase thioredoxin [Clostridium tyrobutyricum]|jgi:thioredoxin 1|uniref:Thioredoxin n=1 Tax=Clostridium tyrobutyricum DIVETGP TaxID=1408889 RepID=W6N320_CLOTY|nr:thioredoxin domain-containing protein [Clostridium tyrobutyricum]AND84945.1 thioredoxin [Clostridium tyrobutyricum]ANP69512.1 thiol reductase thioredoxin [Clostridium tyrobutyricum]MBV4434835.1 thioredoxin family protein [Clostridium tyrobutyricum]MBV4439932.1 thioredoxin family protein [Clostridium tyrobutyricum]MBV4444987.1 thioredoxin family protein [Clostridium tyrobutyricum]
MKNNIILNIEERNFDRLTFDNKIPVLVLFYAKRCGVCKMLYPILEEIAEYYFRKLKIYSVDVDRYETLAQRFRLKGIPTVLMFKNGEVVEKIVGFNSKKNLDNIVKYHLRNDFNV